MGVPVVTLQGSHFASRVSASMLSAIGMSELITHSLDDYRDLVLHLASESRERLRIRKKITDNLSRESLFDTPRFVRNLEKAYREMWRIHNLGRPPQPMAVGEML